MKRFSFNRMAINAITFLLFFILAFGVPACSPCSNVLPYFDIQNIKAENTRIIANSLYGETAILNNNDSVAFADYVIKCSYDVNYHSHNSGFFTVPSAYAISCLNDGGNGSKEGLEDIIVITKTDYNSFAANDTITSMVSIWLGGTKTDSLKTFVERNKNTLYGDRGFSLKLNNKPQNLTTPYFFTIIIKLGNGEVYTSTTAPVYFR